MVDTVVLGFGTFAIVLLLGISAFFSSSEIAIFSFGRHRIESLVEQGDRRAWVVKRLREDPHQLLVTVLVGNNVANIAVASIATLIFTFYFSAGQAVMVATIFTSVFVLLLGEIAPKSYGVSHVESWALRVAKPVSIAQTTMRPIIFGFEIITKGINQFTGGSTKFESYITRDEIEGIIQTGTNSGALAIEEGEMIRGVFDLSRLPVSAVMIPRLDLPTVDEDASLHDAKQTCIESNMVRIAVQRSDRNDIIGVLDLRDIVSGIDLGKSIDDIMLTPLYIPESKPIDDVLSEMQADRVRLGVVVDEFGTVAGLVTVEDIVEEVVGEIMDRGEIEPIQVQSDGTILASGRIRIAELNEQFGIGLPEYGEFETIAGFMYAESGQILTEGDVIEFNDLKLTVDAVSNKRIVRVSIERTSLNDVIEPVNTSNEQTE